jgi:N-acetylneuraminic acid mutarotase
MKKLLLLYFIISGSESFAQQNTWVQKTNFPAASRSFSIGMNIGNKGYMGIGRDSSIWYSDFWEYDPFNDSWSQKANFPVQEYGLMSFSIGAYGYVYNGAVSTNNFYAYDQVLNTWILKADFPGTPRFQGVGFNIGNKGYMGIGYKSGTYFSDFWEYDPLLNSWTQKANFGGTARSQPVGFNIGNKGYVSTGNDGTNLRTDTWEYDPTGNYWMQKADLPAPGRWGASGFSIGDKGFIATGGDTLIDLWQYDALQNSWLQKANFPGGARYGAPCFVIDFKAYVGLGKDPTVYYNDLWSYTPDNTVGIEEFEIKNFEVKLFPNPFSTSAMFNFERPLQNAILKIMDGKGSLVVELKNISGMEFQLNQNKISSGIYIYQLIEKNIIVAKGKFEVR